MRSSPIADVDLVVEGSPGALARELARRIGGRVVATSLFETCLVEGPARLRIDVAMSRREVYRGPAALPVIYPAPIEEDLLRRDFTINSMAIALSGPAKGALLDPSGGERDLGAGWLRIHHPRSLVDDPTRSFRGARYAARLGLRAAAGWRPAIAAAERAGAFAKLGASRLKREIDLVGAEADPAEALRRCGAWGLLVKLDSRLSAAPSLLAAVARAGGEAAGEAGRSSVFLSLLAWSLPPARRKPFCSRLGLSGDAARKVAAAAAAASRAGDLFREGRAAPSRARVERAAEISEWSEIEMVAAAAACGPRVARALRAERAAWERARPRLRGDRIAEMGVPRGPKIAAILRALREERFLGRVRTSRQERAMAMRWVLSEKAP